jgi:hypothetical protein
LRAFSNCGESFIAGDHIAKHLLLQGGGLGAPYVALTMDFIRQSLSGVALCCKDENQICMPVLCRTDGSFHCDSDTGRSGEGRKNRRSAERGSDFRRYCRSPPAYICGDGDWVGIIRRRAACGRHFQECGADCSRACGSACEGNIHEAAGRF